MVQVWNKIYFSKQLKTPSALSIGRKKCASYYFPFNGFSQLSAFRQHSEAFNVALKANEVI